MRYIIIIVLFFISCSKQVERTGNNFYYTNAGIQSFGIQGVRTTCDVVKFSGADKKSLSITMHTDNGYFVQTGYHTFSGSTVPFLQVWLNGQQVGTDAVFLANPPLNFGGKQSFSIYNVPGTTKWRSTRGGIDCIEFTLGSQAGNNAVLYTEIGPVASPSKFPKINFYPAIEILIAGQWQMPSSGIVVVSTWGIEGQLQKPLLRADELNIGTGIPIIPYDTYLWNNN